MGGVENEYYLKTLIIVTFLETILNLLLKQDKKQLCLLVVISERKLSVSVSVSTLLKLSVSANILVHSPAKISALGPAKIPT